MGPDMTAMQGKKVLITGGLGFIGSNLAHECLKLGAEVSIYDCLEPHSGGRLYNVHDIKDSVKLCYHDILEYTHLSEWVVDKDIIFNCAASTSHPFSMREPWIDMDVNVRGVINLLEVIRRFNSAAKFVQVGTSTQLGKLRDQPADELHPEFPMDIYSANKSVAEKYVLIYSGAYQLRVSVIRLSNVFGPRATVYSPDFTVNNYFIGLALQGKDISVYGDGKQKRNVIFVDDAVSALISVALSDKANGEVFFAVGDKHYSITEIAEETMRCMGTGKVRFVDWPEHRRSIDSGDVIISNRKIKELLKWSPKYDLQSGLLRTKEYYATCLEHYLK